MIVRPRANDFLLDMVMLFLRIIMIIFDKRNRYTYPKITIVLLYLNILNTKINL